MSDAARASNLPRYRPDPADEADLLAFRIEDTVKLTADELAEWERTGAIPATVDARLAQCRGSQA